MKTDVAGHGRRGLAIGVNEFVGYAGTAIAAYAAGALAAAGGSRVAPFVLGEVLALGGLVVALFAADTSSYLARERAQGRFRARSRGFVVVCHAGLVTKLADVAAWGLLPLHFRDRGASLAVVAALAAAYPAAWAALQPFTG